MPNYKLLSQGSTKINKSNTIQDEYFSRILYLAPDNLADGKRTVCPYAKVAKCSEACLNSAGMGVFSNVQQARIRKTLMFLNETEKFLDLLIKDIDKFVKECDKLGKKPALRLNGTSDIQWETIEEPLMKMIMKTNPEVVMCGDDYGYNMGLQMPADHWRKFIKPILANYVKMAHDGGAKFILHSCGDLHEIFPDFVEIGIDGVESLKPKNNDLSMYREKYPEITLVGTIDDSEMLVYESPESVRNSVKKSIQTLGKKGGYIPGPTNFLLDQPPENIVALYKAIQEFGKY